MPKFDSTDEVYEVESVEGELEQLRPKEKEVR
jgi:hypothetical protein